MRGCTGGSVSDCDGQSLCTWHPFLVGKSGTCPSSCPRCTITYTDPPNNFLHQSSIQALVLTASNCFQIFYLTFLIVLIQVFGHAPWWSVSQLLLSLVEGTISHLQLHICFNPFPAAVPFYIHTSTPLADLSVNLFFIKHANSRYI